MLSRHLLTPTKRSKVTTMACRGVTSYQISAMVVSHWLDPPNDAGFEQRPEAVSSLTALRIIRLPVVTRPGVRSHNTGHHSSVLQYCSSQRQRALASVPRLITNMHPAQKLHRSATQEPHAHGETLVRRDMSRGCCSMLQTYK